jgi:hypothetical protein
MLENDPARFVAAGSVPIREWGHDSVRVEIRNVRLPAVYRRSGTGARAGRITSRPAGYESEGSKIGRLNPCDYRHL